MHATLGKSLLLTAFSLLLTTLPATAADDPAQLAGHILRTSGVQGGFVVHLGCGDGRLTAQLGARDGFLVHGLDTDPAHVAAARDHIRSLGLYGKVSVERLLGRRLPYADNLVNLLVADDLGAIPMADVMRVLAPGGVACLKHQAEWATTVKPRPREIDDWTHYLYDATGNAVSNDLRAGAPRYVQWIADPKFARHHDAFATVGAMGRPSSLPQVQGNGPLHHDGPTGYRTDRSAR